MSTPEYLGMSDEELMKMAPPTDVDTSSAPLGDAGSVDESALDQADEQVTAPATEAATGDEAGDEGGQEAKATEVTATTTPEGVSGAEADAGSDKTGTATADPGEGADQTAAKSADDEIDSSKAVAGEKPAVAEASVVIDYEAEYKKLLAPFKANGRDIKVDSVDDAITLMQMGANYNKKMAALKPNLTLMKMLEKNGLLSEEKISFLIDLEQKKPEAINKLIKDGGINPLDLDAEKAGEYKPGTHTVDERELALDAVLEEIQDSPTYPKVLELVGKEWDGASKQIVAQNPQLLKVINGHMASGVYDLISTEIERERLLGRLTGLSDLEAYRKVGDAIHARGGFDHLAQGTGSTAAAAAPTPSPAAPAPVVTKVVSPAPAAPVDPKIQEKRRAAAPTRVSAPSTVPASFNPLAMSDEDFAKMAAPQYR